MAPNAEPDGEYDELGKEERFQKSKRGVVRGVQGKNKQSRKSDHDTYQDCVLSKVGWGEGDRTASRKPIGNTGGKVRRNLRRRHGFERADDALVEMLDCGWRQIVGV